MSAFGSPRWLPPDRPHANYLQANRHPTQKEWSSQISIFQNHIREVPNKRARLLNWLYSPDRSKMTEVRFHKLMQAERDSFHPMSCPEGGRESWDELRVQRTVEQISSFQTTDEIVFSSSRRSLKPLPLTFRNPFWVSCSPLHHFLPHDSISAADRLIYAQEFVVQRHTGPSDNYAGG